MQTNTNTHKSGDDVTGTYDGQGGIDTSSGSHYIKVDQNFNNKEIAEGVAGILLEANNASKK